MAQIEAKILAAKEKEKKALQAAAKAKLELEEEKKKTKKLREVIENCKAKEKGLDVLIGDKKGGKLGPKFMIKNQNFHFLP